MITWHGSVGPGAAAFDERSISECKVARVGITMSAQANNGNLEAWACLNVQVLLPYHSNNVFGPAPSLDEVKRKHSTESIFSFDHLRQIWFLIEHVSFGSRMNATVEPSRGQLGAS